MVIREVAGEQLTASIATLDEELVEVESTESDKGGSVPNDGIWSPVPFATGSCAWPLATSDNCTEESWSTQLAEEVDKSVGVSTPFSFTDCSMEKELFPE